ncbi:MAG: hypothetical protein LUD51_00265 [Clostridia bacterium]|nr:hypothetical protein [Clostridia bacterium]
MKFVWAVVAVLVILAIVVSLMSIFSDCNGDDEEASAGDYRYEASYAQEPACADVTYAFIMQ